MGKIRTRSIYCPSYCLFAGAAVSGYDHRADYYPYSATAQVVKEKEMDWNAHITEQFMTLMDTFTRYVYNLPFGLVQNREFWLYQAEESDY